MNCHKKIGAQALMARPAGIGETGIGTVGATENLKSSSIKTR
jgi:hypothetical protein